MAKNFRQQGSVLTATAPAGGVVSGEGVLIGTCFGVAAYDAPEGSETELNIEGVWSLPKAAGVVSGFGAALYWNSTAKNVTTTAAGNTRIGFCARTAAAGDATIDVRLCPPAVASAA
jgi:predicted RecA/RadA family phage recombinase